METKLYVGNLSYNTTDEDLRTLFSQAGTVSSVEVIKDRDSGRSKGFAFVEMSSQAEVESAIKAFNGYSLDNRQLKVSMARPRRTPAGRRRLVFRLSPQEQLQLPSHWWKENYPPFLLVFFK